MSQRKISLYIDPPSHHFLQNRLFDVKQARYAGDQLLAPYAHLREVLASRGVEVATADCMPSVPSAPLRQTNLFVSLGRLGDYRRAGARGDTILSGFFAMECPIVDPALYRALNDVERRFRRVYSWTDSQSLQRFVGRPLRLHQFRWPQSFDAVHDELWNRTDRGFLVMINSNKLPRLDYQELYRERMRAVAWFARTDSIDLYGREWDKPSHRLGRLWIPYTLRKWERDLRGRWQQVRPDPLLGAARKVYKGQADSKSETLSRYTYAICFENMVLKGWITEKLFDCLFAGTVPVYWGAPDIAELVPPECYIDMRRFGSYAELEAYLRGLTPREICAYREAGRAFLASPQFYPFSKAAFADLFVRMIEEDAE